jgi:hypothetical protein
VPSSINTPQSAAAQTGPCPPADCVRAVAQKIAQLQGLFDLLEEHLDVPPPPVKIAHRVRTPAQTVGDNDHQSGFPFDFDTRFHASQRHAFVLGTFEDEGDEGLVRMLEKLAAESGADCRAPFPSFLEHERLVNSISA